MTSLLVFYNGPFIGEMQEYIRNDGSLDPEIHHRPYQWEDTGHRVQDIPWGISDSTKGPPCDYFETMEIYYNR